MNSTKFEFENELDFLGGYHKTLKNIGDRIYNDLSNTDGHLKGKKFGVVKYSELENWDVSYLFGNSKTLKTLSIKLTQMIDKGNADNIKPLINRLVNTNNKSFNWDWTSYALTEKDSQRLKEFFNL